MQPFAERLRSNGCSLNRRAVDVLQVNLGRYCNLACIHCHVESGPTRKEMMSRENVEAVLRFLARTEIPTLDITGGAPELHPDFAYLVAVGAQARPPCHGPLQSDGDLRAGQGVFAGVFSNAIEVELVCSLPCYSKRTSISSAAKELLMRAFARCKSSTNSATANRTAVWF